MTQLKIFFWSMTVAGVLSEALRFCSPFPPSPPPGFSSPYPGLALIPCSCVTLNQPAVKRAVWEELWDATLWASCLHSGAALMLSFALGPGLSCTAAMALPGHPSGWLDPLPCLPCLWTAGWPWLFPGNCTPVKEVTENSTSIIS